MSENNNSEIEEKQMIFVDVKVYLIKDLCLLYTCSRTTFKKKLLRAGLAGLYVKSDEKEFLDITLKNIRTIFEELGHPEMEINEARKFGFY